MVVLSEFPPLSYSHSWAESKKYTKQTWGRFVPTANLANSSALHRLEEEMGPGRFKAVLKRLLIHHLYLDGCDIYMSRLDPHPLNSRLIYPPDYLLFPLGFLLKNLFFSLSSPIYLIATPSFQIFLPSKPKTLEASLSLLHSANPSVLSHSKLCWFYPQNISKNLTSSTPYPNHTTSPHLIAAITS